MFRSIFILITIYLHLYEAIHNTVEPGKLNQCNEQYKTDDRVPGVRFPEAADIDLFFTAFRHPWHPPSF